MEMPRLVEASLRTHQGRVRDHNEDFVACREPANPQEEKDHGWLYIVADGVGGADAGEVASQFASERTIEHYLDTVDKSEWGQRLLDAMQAANTDLRQLVANRNDNSRMATTMVAAVFRENVVHVANVGDSRGYRWHNGELHQITKDQSLVAKLVEEGAITEEEAIFHPRKNVILYSLGSEREPKIDLFTLTAEPGDILLLCSDGLTRHVSDQEIGEVIESNSPETATRILIDKANERGGEDNISAAVLRYGARSQSIKKKTTAGTPEITASGRRLLWLYTIFLSIVQTFLIVLVWLFLRV